MMLAPACPITAQVFARHAGATLAILCLLPERSMHAYWLGLWAALCRMLCAGMQDSEQRHTVRHRHNLISKVPQVLLTHLKSTLKPWWA